MANTEGHTIGTGAAGHEVPFPPFDPANLTPLLVWLAITFGLLYVLMAKVALPRVESILQSRKQKIASDISEAKALQAQCEKAAAAHEKMLAEARAKALALAQETHARLSAETEAKRAALEADLNARLSASEAQILEMKAKAMSHVAPIATETAAAIVERITGRRADTKAIAAAIAAVKA